jgi:hypothetical protein
MMKAPKLPDAPPPPPPAQSPTSFGGKKKPNMGMNPIPTFLGSDASPAASGGKTLLGQ